MLNEIDLSDFFYNPEVLAKKVLEVYFSHKKPSYPIDPFDILNYFKVPYQFRNFEGLEGIYILPENEQDIPIIGINNKRPISRQRFTAAHELCHHIKDKNSNSFCPIGKNNNPVEKYADKFASKLLMPQAELAFQVKKLEENNYIDFTNIIYISDYFGVSFESCVFNIAYTLKKIEGDTDPKTIKKRIRKFKPDTKRIELGIKKYNPVLLKNIINSYEYFFENESKVVWYNFKRDFVYNENKLEGINIESEAVSEILTDLRIHKQEDRKSVV